MLASDRPMDICDGMTHQVDKDLGVPQGSISTVARDNPLGSESDGLSVDHFHSAERQGL